MARVRVLGGSLMCLAVLASPVWAQDEDRIWGRLSTTSGDVYEGFIRWDRNEGSWVDILDGSKRIPDENYLAWLQARQAAGPPLRRIDLSGYRISWREADPNFSLTAASGIRFGHLGSLRVVESGAVDGDADRVELTLRSGEVLEFEGGATDLGRSNREILVEVPGRAPVELDWSDLERIDFSAVPSGARASSSRLYGTVEDEEGNRFRGYVSWDLDEILESDVLDGEEMRGGQDREIPFGDIASITRLSRGARVVLADGDTIDLTGGRDVDRGNRGIQISDPELGMVEVEWREFDNLRFHRASESVGYDAFDGGQPLAGTVVTQSGEDIRGLIRWDADEGSSWELLNGRTRNAAFTIELAKVSRIERGEVSGATVTLLDGRTFDLDDANDVDWDNKGILIAPEGVDRGVRADGSPWRVIPWDEFREVRFRHDPGSAGGVAAPEPGRSGAERASGQTGANTPSESSRPIAPDTFLDPVAGTLFEAARANWRSVDESIVRYTALIQQRIAAAIRTPLKDRILYRNETAVRAFWDQDYNAVVQVLGTHSQYPGRSIAVREGDLDWLEDLPFDEPFEPGGDRLLFGLNGDGDNSAFEQNDDDAFWVAHPLTSGADSLYRYESGDTLSLSLPDGRRLQTIRLDVLPREADIHRISGSLWIEPESGALVRAVYRLSRQFDALRDVPELQEEEERGSFRYVPGLFKPWTFELAMVAVEYSLWNFEVWLPRSMRVEGAAAAGILEMPVSMDISYQMESVTTQFDLDREAEAERLAGLEERDFRTRAEAMAFIAGLLSEQDGIVYELASRREDFARGRRSLMIVPEDRSLVATSPHLPPPIWEEAAGFPSDDQLEDYVDTLADLPVPTVESVPFEINWGWARPDLIRFNRVEGLAVGGRFEATLGGPYSLDASGFFGFGDHEPKARLGFERSTVRRRLGLGVYRELTATDPRGGYLGFGNSVYGILFGRDDGEYYRATGVDFTWRPPVGARESFELRGYAERQGSVSSKEINFALFHAFDRSWAFRPNVDAGEVEEVGAELRLSPWWGGDPFLTQFGLEVYGQVARWRTTGESAQATYGRTSAVLRVAVPLVHPTWRLGLEVGAGTTWGAAPLQRQWFMGGASTLRGYGASTLRGSSFARSRVELARTFDIGAVSLFGDVGWAGVRGDFNGDDLLYAIGVGGSALDGLFRIDFSHGLKGPAKEFRIDLYLDALL